MVPELSNQWYWGVESWRSYVLIHITTSYCTKHGSYCRQCWFTINKLVILEGRRNDRITGEREGGREKRVSWSGLHKILLEHSTSSRPIKSSKSFSSSLLRETEMFSFSFFSFLKWKSRSTITIKMSWDCKVKSKVR